LNIYTLLYTHVIRVQLVGSSYNIMKGTASDFLGLLSS